MSKKINFEIVTPERTILKDKVESITIPTQKGQITVLSGHIPLIAILAPGEIIVKNEGKDKVYMAVSGGFVEVLVNKVVILADTAERAEEIDESRAQEAKERAEKLKEEKRGDAREFAALSAKIEKEMARLKVARRRRKI